MEPYIKPCVILGFVLLIFLVLFVRHRLIQQWKLEVKTDFEAALRHLRVERHEVLTDRSVYPGGNRPGEVYRILHNQNGQYFLYLHTPGSPGILQPLTRERALLAAKFND